MKSLFRNIMTVVLLISLVALLPASSSAEAVKGGLAASGNLSLSNIAFEYEDAPDQYNPGSIGKLYIKFTVNGPAEVRDVLISSTGTSMPDESRILHDVQPLVDSWKEQITSSTQTPPFPSSNGFPIYEEDLGTTLYVTMIGLDAQMDSVGYAVIKIAIPSGSDPEPSQPSVSLSKTKLTIKDGKAYTVKATLGDATDSIKSVKSDKTKVAKASFSGNDIVITPKSVGKANITVKTAKGATVKIAVTVKAGCSLNETSVTLKKGKSFKVKVHAIPASVKAKSFKSSKPSVATVSSSGKITARKKGNATITVVLNNGKTLKLKVTVK